MTKEEIIRIAREARIEQDGDMFYSFRNSDKDQDVHIDDLVRFAQAAYAAGAAAEREAIARRFDGHWWGYDYREIATAIRARGKV